MELLQYKLDNGIRLVHQRTNGMVAHCGLILNTGSRDEREKEHGMAHFIEHMLFKGTIRRKPYYIFSCLDNAGGELNAYTTKEETAIHASVLKEDFEKAVDLISDLTYNSTFPEKEIIKENSVRKILFVLIFLFDCSATRNRSDSYRNGDTWIFIPIAIGTLLYLPIAIGMSYGTSFSDCKYIFQFHLTQTLS